MVYSKVELPLVERDNVFKDIDDVVQQIQYALKDEYAQKSAIINIYGNGGYGKTYLKKGYENFYLKKEKVAFYDFDKTKDVGIDEILYSWALSIRKTNSQFRFDLFSYTYDKYQQIVQTNRKSCLKENVYDNKLVSCLRTIAVDLISAKFKGGIFLSVANTLLDIVPQEIYEKIVTVFSKNKIFLQQVNLATHEIEIRELLKIAFIKDMEENLAGTVRPLLFFIDTYEVYSSNERIIKKYTDDWLKSIVSSIDGVVWVISGRGRLVWDEVKISKIIELKGFQEESSFETIFNDSKISITNKDHCKYIKELSEGYPLVLYNCINQYLSMRDKDDFRLEQVTGEIQDVIMRVFTGLNETQIDLMELLSLIGDWTDDSIVEVFSCDKLKVVQYKKCLETLKKMNLTQENKIEREIADCIKKQVSIEKKEVVFENLVSFIQSQDDYYFKKAFDLYLEILLSNSEIKKEFEALLIEYLKETIENNILVFESMIFSLMKKKQDLSENIKAYVIVLYRKYLVETNLLEECKAELECDELENQIFALIRQDCELLVDLAVFYMETDNVSRVKKIVEYFENEYFGEKIYFYYLQLRLLFYLDEWDAYKKLYCEYKQYISKKEYDIYEHIDLKIQVQYILYLMADGRCESSYKEAWELYEMLRKKDSSSNNLKELKSLLSLNSKVPKEIRIQFAEEELQYVEQLYGREQHPIVRKVKRHLADVLKITGEYEKACKLYIELLKGQKIDDSIAYWVLWDRLSVAECYIGNKNDVGYRKALKKLEPVKEMRDAINRIKSLCLKAEILTRYAKAYYTVLKECQLLDTLQLWVCLDMFDTAKKCGESYYNGRNYKMKDTYIGISMVKLFLREEEWKKDMESVLELTKNALGEKCREYKETQELYLSMSKYWGK